MKLIRKTTAILLVIFLLWATVIDMQIISTSYARVSSIDENETMGDLYKINVLILHPKDNDDYLPIYHQLKQSMIANTYIRDLEINEVNLEKLKNYQVVYLDSSLAYTGITEENIKDIKLYVEDGGHLFIENEFYNVFSKDFIGAESFVKIDALPDNLIYPNVSYNEKPIQDIVKDFYSLYKKYRTSKPSEITQLGFGMIPSTAKSIVSCNDLSLYTINEVGKGKVFFTSGLLPNKEFVEGYDFKNRDNPNNYFTFTTTSANSMLRNGFIEYSAKETQGYVIKKIFGPNGRPGMAWQNHFEVLHSINDGSMSKWIDFLKDYNQIPSFTLVRGAFNWGEWKENVVYHLNVGTDEEQIFIGELDESCYSSGQKTFLKGDYFTLEDYPEYKSYGWEIELPVRAYPYVKDINDDNIPDLISGSKDGKVYLCKGQTLKPIWSFSSKEEILLKSGESLQVEGYSTPVLYDINLDGKDDLIVGSQSGKIYKFINTGEFIFEDKGEVLNTYEAIKYSAPTIGDFDGDKTDDIVIGSGNGQLYWAKGIVYNNQLLFANLENVKTQDGEVWLDKFTAPSFIDYNNDEKMDLVVGTNQGYMTKLKNTYPTVEIDGHIEGNTKNKFGSSAIWTGHNSVPFFYDINNDGRTDLVEGQLSFGFGIPIDSQNFPYEKKLRQELKYAKENGIEMCPHIYVHEFKSPEQEEKEIELHKQAFKYYNLPWTYLGTNQHTWCINRNNPTQTFNSEMKYGIWWNSGFRASNSPIEPSFGSEFVWGMPFKLTEGRQTKDMVIFTPAPFYYNYKGLYDYIGKWDLPISYFYHIEKPINNEEGIEFLTGITEGLNKFRYKYNYNFMSETQMAKSFMTAIDSEVYITDSFDSSGITLIPRVYAKEKYVGSYQNALGVKVEIGEKYLDRFIKTDADIYLRDGKDIYLGLNKAVNIDFVTNRIMDKPHITMVNQPISIDSNIHAMRITFKDKGLNEITFYAPNGIKTFSKGWKMDKQGEYVTLTKYGNGEVLSIKIK